MRSHICWNIWSTNFKGRGLVGLGRQITCRGKSISLEMHRLYVDSLLYSPLYLYLADYLLQLNRRLRNFKEVTELKIQPNQLLRDGEELKRVDDLEKTMTRHNKLEDRLCFFACVECTNITKDLYSASLFSPKLWAWVFTECTKLYFPLNRCTVLWDIWSTDLVISCLFVNGLFLQLSFFSSAPPLLSLQFN